ncbi:unnamed protein product [Mucor hiemalis]
MHNGAPAISVQFSLFCLQYVFLISRILYHKSRTFINNLGNNKSQVFSFNASNQAVQSSFERLARYSTSCFNDRFAGHPI